VSSSAECVVAQGIGSTPVAEPLRQESLARIQGGNDELT
jgi:hypothetical protein